MVQRKKTWGKGIIFFIAKQTHNIKKAFIKLIDSSKAKKGKMAVDFSKYTGILDEKKFKDSKDSRIQYLMKKYYCTTKT